MIRKVVSPDVVNYTELSQWLCDAKLMDDACILLKKMKYVKNEICEYHDIQHTNQCLLQRWKHRNDCVFHSIISLNNMQAFPVYPALKRASTRGDARSLWNDPSLEIQYLYDARSDSAGRCKVVDRDTPLTFLIKHLECVRGLTYLCSNVYQAIIMVSARLYITCHILWKSFSISSILCNFVQSHTFVQSWPPILLGLAHCIINF